MCVLDSNIGVKWLLQEDQSDKARYSGRVLTRTARAFGYGHIHGGMRPRVYESTEAGESNHGRGERVHGRSADHAPTIPSSPAPPAPRDRNLPPGSAWRLRLPLHRPCRAGGVQALDRRHKSSLEPPEIVSLHHRSRVAALITVPPSKSPRVRAASWTGAAGTPVDSRCEVLFLVSQRDPGPRSHGVRAGRKPKTKCDTAKLPSRPGSPTPSGEPSST
jgi:hypothetical protein